MKKPYVDKFRKRFKLSCAFAITTTLSLIAIVVCAYTDVLQPVHGYMIAGAFWTGLLLEILFILLARRAGRRAISESGNSGSSSSNPESLPDSIQKKCAEGALFVSIAAMMLTLIADVRYSWIRLAVFCMTFVSLNACLIYGGMNYKYKRKILKIKGQDKNE